MPELVQRACAVCGLSGTRWKCELCPISRFATTPLAGRPTRAATSRPLTLPFREQMTALLYLVFVLSGAAGLIYESVWSRYLGLFVGHSAYAQIIVLVIFLGGMSLGAHLAGKRSERLRSPLLWYAGVEIGVGTMALVFHDIFGWATAAAYDSIFPSLSGPGLTVVKWTIASALILP